MKFSLFLLPLALCAVLSPTAMAQEACPDPPPHVEATPRPTPQPGPKTWDKDAPLGTVIDTDGTPATDDEGNPLYDGRMIEPQDQRADNPAPVKVRVGSLVPYSAESASDTDHWSQTNIQQPDCSYGDQEDWTHDTIEGVWSCTGGEFVTVDGVNYWQAPSTPGQYTIKVKFDDGEPEVEAPEQGERDDAALVRTCEITVYKLSVSFVDTVVAAGNVDDDAHRAQFEITASDGTNVVPNVPVDEPEIEDGTGLGPDEDITAYISEFETQTGSDGKATGYLVSGHRTAPTVIKLDNSMASVGQVWNELPDDEAWVYEDYFDFDEPSSITFNMAFKRNETWEYISGHDITFESQAISGWRWNEEIGEDLGGDGEADGDYEYQEYASDDSNLENWNIHQSRINWDNLTESSSGAYTVTQTVFWDVDFVVDYAEFGITDHSVYEGE